MSKKKTKKLDPRVERLLQLIIEARRARSDSDLSAMADKSLLVELKL